MTVTVPWAACPTARVPRSIKVLSRVKLPGGLALPVTLMVRALPPVAATVTLPLIGPATVGVATIESVQEALTARLPVQPVAATPDGVTVRVPAAVPLLVIITVAGVEGFPTSGEPTLTVAALAARFGTFTGRTPPSVVAASGGVVFSLPPQPTTVSMPISPRQLA